MNKFLAVLVLFFASFASLSALDQADEQAIQQLINNYTNSWNHQGGVGFGEAFTNDADFVSIFGRVLSGSAEIEAFHIKLLQSFLKGSSLEINNIKLREVQPGVATAIVNWKLNGFRNPRGDLSKVVTVEGVYHPHINQY